MNFMKKTGPEPRLFENNKESHPEGTTCNSVMRAPAIAIYCDARNATARAIIREPSPVLPLSLVLYRPTAHPSPLP